MTGGMLSSMPPPNTQTPASFASWTTACEASETACRSPSGRTMAALGNEIRYLVIRVDSFFAARAIAFILADEFVPRNGLGGFRGGRCPLTDPPAGGRLLLRH